jgi:hypothetical protein
MHGPCVAHNGPRADMLAEAHMATIMALWRARMNAHVSLSTSDCRHGIESDVLQYFNSCEERRAMRLFESVWGAGETHSGPFAFEKKRTPGCVLG